MGRGARGPCGPAPIPPSPTAVPEGALLSRSCNWRLKPDPHTLLPCVYRAPRKPQQEGRKVAPRATTPGHLPKLPPHCPHVPPCPTPCPTLTPPSEQTPSRRQHRCQLATHSGGARGAAQAGTVACRCGSVPLLGDPSGHVRMWGQELEEHCHMHSWETAPSPHMLSLRDWPPPQAPAGNRSWPVS